MQIQSKYFVAFQSTKLKQFFAHVAMAIRQISSEMYKFSTNMSSSWVSVQYVVAVGQRQHREMNAQHVIR